MWTLLREELVAGVVGLREFGLDTVSGEVLTRPYDGRIPL